MEEDTGLEPAPAADVQPSPAPRTPDNPLEWNAVIRDFLSAAGLTQAMRGFDADMVIMNPSFERDIVPGALDNLLDSLVRMGKQPQRSPQRPLDQRKLEHVNLRPGTEPRTQNQTIKDISLFLARNRARNDASNRAEFLVRRSQNPEGDPQGDAPSCARTDAKPVNRDVQMKYDIAKNDDGPLRSTLRTEATSSAEQPSVSNQSILENRLRDVEDHLAIRYVPLPPNSNTDRLKLIEDHIIQLERNFPPWAALHLNQPNREWPPPPQQTPIIVPPRMLAVSDPSLIPVNPSTDAAPKKQTRADSSLRKAVLERLEVQQAMNTRNRGIPMDVDRG